MEHMQPPHDLEIISFFSFLYVSPSPIPEFSKTPQENHIADDKVRASSSSSSLFTLNLPNGLKGNIGRLQEIKWGYVSNSWNKKTLASPGKESN